MTAAGWWPRVARAGLAALCLLAAAWMVASLWWPPGFDHGLYLWTANTVLGGGMVYRDAWDMHGPLVAYVYALPLALAGQRFWGVRLVDVAVVGAAAAAVARLTIRAVPAPARPAGGRVGRAAAVWAGAVLVLAYASNESEYVAQPDGWVGLLTAAVLAPAALAPRPRLAHMALAGAVAGLFALVKPFYGMFVFVPLAYYAADAGRDFRTAARAAAPAAALAALVSAVPVALAAAWFAHRGALGALWELHVQYAGQVYNGDGLRLGRRAAAVAAFALGGKVVPVTLAAAFVGALALWRSDQRPQRALLASLVAWVAVALFCVLLQDKYYQYHWIPVYPPLILLGAVGLAAGLGGAEPAGRAFAAAAAVVIAAQASAGPLSYVRQWGSYAAGRTSPGAYYMTFRDNSSSRPWENMRVGRYLRERTPPSATVAAWGFDPAVLFHARRRGAFRAAAWIHPLRFDAGPAQDRYEAEYLRDLRERTPDYFVVNTRFDPRSRSTLQTHPAIAREVAERFVLDTTLGRFQVWRRRAVRAGGEHAPPPPRG